MSLLIAFLLIASTIVTIFFAVQAVRSELYRQSREAMDNVHTAVSDTIQADYRDIATYPEEATKRRKQMLRDESKPLVTALNTLRGAVASGELTTQEAQRLGLKMLKGVRYGNDDYFFTYNRDLKAIAHPDKRFQGRNLANLKDADGNYVLRNIRKVALSKGNGFVAYRWQRLNGNGSRPKIAYVFHYKPWDWIIGTGVYVDDINAEVQARIDGVRSDLQVMSDRISFQNDGFFFVLDQKAQLVAGANPRLVAATATPEGQQALRDIVAAAPTQPGVTVTKRVDTPWLEGEPQSWSVQISDTGDDLDWILVSAVPTRRLETPGARLALQLVGVSIVVTLIGLALGLLLTRRLTRPVDDISAAARRLQTGTFDPATLDDAAARSDELGDLARSFQEMGTKVVERERRLREKVEQLSVQIDRTKVSEEVEQITESEYFQQLKARSEELRRRDN